MLFYIIFSIVALISIFLVIADRFVFKEDENRRRKVDTLMKILSVIFVAVSFIDIFMPDAFSYRHLGTKYINLPDEYLLENHDPFHAVLRIFNAAAIVTIPFAIFYRKKQLNRTLAFLIIPFTIISIIFANDFIAYFTDTDPSHTASVFGEQSRAFLQNITFRSILFGLIMLLQLVLSLYSVLRDKSQLKFKDRRDVGKFILVAVCLLLTNMPICAPQQMFADYSTLVLEMGKSGHLLWIMSIIVEGLIISLLFKNESYENKYILVFIMTLSLLFQYNSFFRTDGIITTTRYPLQLCNIAGLFLVIMLLTRSEKMFHFTLVINVVGAVIAMVICDSTFVGGSGIGMLYCMDVHYMVEHTNVILVPLLCAILHIFKPLKKKDVIHFVVGFTFYFLLVLVLGTIFYGLYLETGNDYWNCNYLFMFDKARSVNLVGFVGPFFDVKLPIYKNFYLSLVQLLVYITFLAICVGIFFILYSIFKEKKPNKLAKE